MAAIFSFLNMRLVVYSVLYCLSSGVCNLLLGRDLLTDLTDWKEGVHIRISSLSYRCSNEFCWCDNSLAHERYCSNLKRIILILIIQNGNLCIQCEIALRRMPLNTPNEKAISHYLGHRWSKPSSPYGVTRPNGKTRHVINVECGNHKTWNSEECGHMQFIFLEVLTCYFNELWCSSIKSNKWLVALHLGVLWHFTFSVIFKRFIDVGFFILGSMLHIWFIQFVCILYGYQYKTTRQYWGCTKHLFRLFIIGDVLSDGHLTTIFNAIWIQVQAFSVIKMRLKMLMLVASYSRFNVTLVYEMATILFWP